TILQGDWSSDVCSSDLSPSWRNPALPNLILWRRRFGRAGFLQDGEGILRGGQAGKARRAKENNRVLNFLAAKTRERLSVLREDRSEERRVGKECRGWWT